MEGIETGIPEPEASKEPVEDKQYSVTLRKPVFNYFADPLTQLLSSLRLDGNHNVLIKYLESDEGKLAEQLSKIKSSDEFKNGDRVSLTLTKDQIHILRSKRIPNIDPTLKIPSDSAVEGRLYNEMRNEFDSGFNIPIKEQIADIKSSTSSTARRLLGFLSRKQS